MADSRTEAILDAIVDTLSEPTGQPAGLEVNRSRKQPVKQTDLPMISVYPSSERTQLAIPNHRRCNLTDRTLTVRIRCRAAGDDAALDPLRQWVIARMGTDLSLGGLTSNLAESGSEWETIDASNGDTSFCDFLYDVRYQTARADLTRAA